VAGVGLGLAVHSLAGGSSGSSTVSRVRGQAIWPQGVRKAPEISLPDSEGKRFHLSSLRGRPVIVTFMDSHCHAECPIEGRQLAAAFRQVPASERPVVVVVSVNPWEDTPGSVRRGMKRFGLAGFDWVWLMGTEKQLQPTWKRYNIYVHRVSGDVEHSDALYLVDSSGYERAGMLFPFLPTWISTDLETLAAES
jgi:protein SCO1/2